jgi:hypothetical protein
MYVIAVEDFVSQCLELIIYYAMNVVLAEESLSDIELLWCYVLCWVELG